MSDMVSSVKVEGTNCCAYGYNNTNCTGTKGNPIRANTSLTGLPMGVVSTATGIETFWGCNDCAQCVSVKQCD